MPFKSKQQQKYMFATHPKIAQQWAKETPNMEKLPKYVRGNKSSRWVPKSESLQEAILQVDLEFWVLERPTSPTDDVKSLIFKTDPFAFAKQVMAGLTREQVYGFYLDESDAVADGEQLLGIMLKTAKSLEEKKGAVTSKIEEVIKKLQKEINSCLEEGSDESVMKAEGLMQKIKELREKHKMVEASKQPIDEKKAKKDWDKDGKVEDEKDEYAGVKDNAIKKAMGKEDKKKVKESKPVQVTPDNTPKADKDLESSGYSVSETRFKKN